MSYLQHSRLRDEELIHLEEQAKNAVEEFERDLALKLSMMTDQELRASLKKAGINFDDEQSQQDYKNSLKNDY